MAYEASPFAIPLRRPGAAHRHPDHGDPPTKHHAAYVTNVNKALEGHADLADKPIEEVLREHRAGPGGHPPGGHQPRRRSRQPLRCSGGSWARRRAACPRGNWPTTSTSVFGGFDAFKDEFTKAATARFGSGWAWLVLDTNGKLIVTSTPNQDSPLMQGNTPMLGLDVWEHAYYLKYQNRRADYISAWWNVVNWDMVARDLRRGAEVAADAPAGRKMQGRSSRARPAAGARRVARSRRAGSAVRKWLALTADTAVAPSSPGRTSEGAGHLSRARSHGLLPRRPAHLGRAGRKRSAEELMRALSGIQPTGELHLGNYFGAMKQHIELQTEHEGFYFIANYHSLTTVQDAELPAEADAQRGPRLPGHGAGPAAR